MGIVRGTNIVQDGLVFGYDTGYGIADKTRSLRFYKGEPASNVQDSDISAMTQTGFNNWGAYDGNNTPHHTYSSTTQTKTLVNILGPDGELTNAMLYHNVSGGSFGPTNWSGVPSANLANGKKITLQAWVKAADSSFVGKSVRPHLYYSKVGGGAYSASTNHTLTMEWQLVKHCYTVPEGATGNGTFYLFTGSGETKMYVTQTAIIADKLDSVVWLQGGTTRSDTASLIDLKRTTNIDVSDVSFDSTGQPDFDGTDDHIVASPSNISLGTSLTYEVWIYPTGYNHSRMYLMDPRGDGNTSGTNTYFLFDYHQSPDTVHVVAGNSNIEVQSSNFSMPLNNWHNIVATRNGNSWVIYHNGVSVGTGTTNTTSLTLNNNFRIGTYASGSSGQYFFEGLMAVAKIYSKALSIAEVTQNYKAYKNRFNI